MGVEYSLLNQTKREQLTFAYMPVGRKREIAGNPASAALVAWYMLEHPQDEIRFVSDSDGEWPFKVRNRDETFGYLDVTNSLAVFKRYQKYLA